MLYRIRFDFSSGPEVFEFEAVNDEAADRYITELLGFCPVCRAALQSRTDCIDFDLC